MHCVKYKVSPLACGTPSILDPHPSPLRNAAVALSHGDHMAMELTTLKKITNSYKHNGSLRKQMKVCLWSNYYEIEVIEILLPSTTQMWSVRDHIPLQVLVVEPRRTDQNHEEAGSTMMIRTVHL